MSPAILEQFSSMLFTSSFFAFVSNRGSADDGAPVNLLADAGESPINKRRMQVLTI